mmetsp:Transcript_78656/g.108945  ORF Transcript_78656/g.108945 Transcript_78656/m.108945 type:complete len:89 (+) Transcript_78656:126-392(+)|eukprot:CAMPEP_0176344230 /NCGR_PEP_ID=MMETSP0126-20121128/4542_1 /TAXON_ID=141414 ORGANISM="Strombidinopsis acuminatum, Strain SPMC142" /NCGR_SAMPLE_ID=MMETSP0126 /ASSEMBLY_ACC=CAM_ASM_000229 /LENGTH=88 /DNA_ID=CAMNT_0017690583 /DNA_START=124 /DNA_END=390 /DNA_ORIENTATION=+
MDNSSSRDRARAAALAKAKPSSRQGLSGKQGTVQNRGNQLNFFSEDASGMKMSPHSVMLLCLIYVGLVVLLHIFGKIKSVDTQAKKDF